MGFLIAGGAIVFFGFTLLVIGIGLGRSAVRFDANKRYAKAEVVGYRRAEQSNWYELYIRIPELNDGKTYFCTSGRISLRDYPVGKIVDILYAPTKTMGIHVVEAHLVEKPPADSATLARGIKGVSKVLLIVGILLALAGLLSFII